MLSRVRLPTISNVVRDSLVIWHFADGIPRLVGIFNKVQGHINAKDKTWRFACDHTWAPKVTELKSKYGDYDTGTKIEEIWCMSSIPLSLTRFLWNMQSN